MGSPWTPERQAKANRTNEMRRVVDAYLVALEDADRQASRRERLSPQQLDERITTARAEAADLSGVTKLKKIQEVQDLQARLDALSSPKVIDLTAVEEAFIEVAATYGAQNGITYKAWREVGVSAAVLRAAGLMKVQTLS